MNVGAISVAVERAQAVMFLYGLVAAYIEAMYQSIQGA